MTVQNAKLALGAQNKGGEGKETGLGGPRAVSWVLTRRQGKREKGKFAVAFRRGI